VSGEEILSTKVTKPNALPNRVERPRLTITFDAERFNRLTLVCAPAGYGKTTLISSCASMKQVSFAWLSLDANDNSPALFLINLIAAVATNIPDFGIEISRVIQTSSSPPIASLGTKLINDISSRAERIVLFLDDYHVIENEEVHKFVVFLLDHQPENLHIVIASRSKPPFSVARLRTHGRLNEIGEADLRFTVSESKDYFNRVMSLDLSEDDVQTLRDRTEGWAAGLQLAALSLRGDNNVSAFIDSFSGVERHVKDFLMDEVLSNLTEQMQSFLFRTSIVERFNAQLCDELTDRNDSVKVLDELERLNMFLVPLDNVRKWYRYHHLFSELLQNRLIATADADELNRLRGKAANWFGDNGFPAEAIKLALMAKDHDTAVKVFDRYAMPYLAQGKISTVVGWIRHLPEATILGSPVVALLAAFAVYFRTNPDVTMVERYLKVIDQAMHSKRYLPKSPEDEQLLARVMLVRGYQARYGGDAEKALTLFNKVCDVLPKQDLFYTTAKVNAGVCHFVLGHYLKASTIFSEYAEIRPDQPNLWITASGFIGLARVQHVRGDLQAARSICESGLKEFAQHGFNDIPVCCLFHYELCELEYEADNLGAAATHGKRSIELANAGGMEFLAGCSQILLAIVKLAQGDKRGLGPQFEQKLLGFWANNSVVIPSMSGNLSKLWLLQGRVQDLAAWYDEREIDTDVLRPGVRTEYMMIARMLLRSQHPEKASALLLRLLPRNEDGQCTGHTIESLILLALARHALGNLAAALDTLQQALHLARDSHYVRLFVDEGLPMQFLLQKIDVDASLRDYREQLLAAFAQNSSQASSSPTAVVPMTSKEAKVAKLIGTGLSNDEIAKRLFVSPHTVKCHVKSIYRKLGVSKRADAALKIRDMNLT
jgi:LuxR family maltose regulon positive regulatory protein